jgi:hypothetical protein
VCSVPKNLVEAKMDFHRSSETVTRSGYPNSLRLELLLYPLAQSICRVVCVSRLSLTYPKEGTVGLCLSKPLLMPVRAR